jgi:DNA-binding cell septation regulator SpoVG
MKIKNMRKISGDSKVKAFFSVEWPGKMTINDCKLVEGRNGLFAAMPSREYVDKKTNKKIYQSIVYVEQDLLDKISRAAATSYYPEFKPDDDIPF